MATRGIFTPFSAEFPASNYPILTLINRRPALVFNDTTNQTCYWSMVAPQGLTSTYSFVITIMMASATTGDTDWDVAVEAVTSGDATDLDAGTSFDTVNSTDNTTVPGTAGYAQQITVTLTNNDSMAAADYLRFSLTRDAASDTATGDAYFLVAEFRDSA